MTTPKPRATSRRKRKYYGVIYPGNECPDCFRTMRAAKAFIEVQPDRKRLKLAMIELREVRTGKGRK